MILQKASGCRWQVWLGRVRLFRVQSGGSHEDPTKLQSGLLAWGSQSPTPRWWNQPDHLGTEGHHGPEAAPHHRQRAQSALQDYRCCPLIHFGLQSLTMWNSQYTKQPLSTWSNGKIKNLHWEKGFLQSTFMQMTPADTWKLYERDHLASWFSENPVNNVSLCHHWTWFFLITGQQWSTR